MGTVTRADGKRVSILLVKHRYKKFYIEELDYDEDGKPFHVVDRFYFNRGKASTLKAAKDIVDAITKDWKVFKEAK